MSKSKSRERAGNWGAVKMLNNADGDDVEDSRGKGCRETEPGKGEEARRGEARPGFSSGEVMKEE
jgi:hypothetical protein